MAGTIGNVTRRVAAAVLTAAVVGLVLGGVSRALMRLVAVAVGVPGHFSWGGTAGILTVYAVAALPGCLLAAFTARRGRSLLLVAAALFLFVPATGVAASEVGATDLTPAQWAGVLASGGGVYLTLLAIPVLALRVLDAVAPHPVPVTRARAAGTARVPRPRLPLARSRPEPGDAEDLQPR